jgi:hypothetical protein
LQTQSRNDDHQSLFHVDDNKKAAAAEATNAVPSSGERKTNNYYTFEERLTHLADYKKNNGNCNVPQRYKEFRNLGQWVATQRSSNYKKKIFMRPNLTVHILQKRKVFLKRFCKSKPNGLQISITKLILRCFTLDLSRGANFLFLMHRIFNIDHICIPLNN